MTYIAFTFVDHFGRKFYNVKSFAGSFDEVKSACERVVSENSQNYKTTWRAMSQTEVRSYKYGRVLRALNLQDCEVDELDEQLEGLNRDLSDGYNASSTYEILESYTQELERLIATTSSIKALRAAVAALKQ